jgi:D-beta-D-heptose 7-phosphate kinase / D-beta-D-heptose 1-phosphate adenosyltransferase
MTDPKQLAARLDRFARTRILCVGDVMLDHYVYGRVDRVSPEAPIPVLRIERETRVLGGAGNVVRNVEALGARLCFVSVIGDDESGREISRLLAAAPAITPHLLVEAGRVTTVKRRYIAGNQQLLRADQESLASLGPAERTELRRLLENSIPEYDVIILSDYAKGVAADGLAAAAIALSRSAGRPIIVDPKGTDYSRYRGATLLKPNRNELALATRMPVDSPAAIIAAARSLIETHAFGAVLVSLSQDGMMLVEASGEVHNLPTTAREVFDVSGAGDTVIATLAVALGAGFPLTEAAQLANIAAGIVVAKVGTAVVHAAELADTLLEHGPAGLQKTASLAAALDHVARWRHRGLKIGFTNGCFDLLHPGHVSLLAQARAACDRLVVGLNSDLSVKRLKGPERPVQAEAARAAVLASLASVDLVVIFEEDTPLELIRAIRPDVLVKGADYRIDEVVGGDLVQSWGGTVLLADLSPGFSTTATIARIGGAGK